jgi:DNA-binding NtrC family response regulator
MNQSNSILLVEDEPGAHEVLRIVLEDEGYEVISATSVKETRALLGSQSFLGAIVDGLLPDGGGLDLVHEICGRGIACVLATGHPAMMAVFREKGLPFLSKPYRADDILARLDTAIKSDKCPS